ncbi:DUF6372 family protein [Nocardia sp. NPDC051981]|uniref:DUF6372 family protein n=1 Tax=Nocardia sp. NPDC051981 TaxID=3155417 RepID=UPI00341E1361
MRVCVLPPRRRGAATCLAGAEPGLLIRVEADGETIGPLTVCRRCYDAIAEDPQPR